MLLGGCPAAAASAAHPGGCWPSWRQAPGRPGRVVVCESPSAPTVWGSSRGTFCPAPGDPSTISLLPSASVHPAPLRGFPGTNSQVHRFPPNPHFWVCSWQTKQRHVGLQNRVGKEPSVACTGEQNVGTKPSLCPCIPAAHLTVCIVTRPAHRAEDAVSHFPVGFRAAWSHRACPAEWCRAVGPWDSCSETSQWNKLPATVNSSRICVCSPHT